LEKLLEGIRVLDFTHVHAGPLCTYQLALMGASVTKVESPQGGDQMRNMGSSSTPGMSPGFLGQNANKRSIAVDLKTSSGNEIVRKLVSQTDVLVINMRPGTADRLGIGYDTCKELKSNIVYCAISGYGQTGPESDRPAMDHLMQGESGMLNATGTQEQPARVGFAIADSSTAVIASSAVNAALVRRERTGDGAYLDVSMLESSMTVMGLNYYGFLATGRIGPRPGANPLASMGSAGTWQTKEGTLLVNANNHRLFQRMANAVGRPDLPSDPRFENDLQNSRNGQALRTIFAEIFITNTAKHWDKLLRDAGVPSGILKTPAETIQHPQLAHRGTIGEIDNVPGMSEPLRFLGPGFILDSDPLVPSEPPPLLGQHTKEILTELGYETTEIKGFLQRGDVAIPSESN